MGRTDEFKSARFADVIALKINAVLFESEDDYFAKKILASLLSVNIIRLFGIGLVECNNRLLWGLLQSLWDAFKSS